MLLLCSERLKNDRKRLKLTQQKLATLLEVSDMTIKRWETGTAIPSDKLILMKNIGFNVSYILFGESDQTISNEENLLIEKYRQADPISRNRILMFLLGGDSEATKTVVKNNKNSVKGQQIGDNNQQHNHFASQQNSSINIENQHGGSIVGIKNK
jgi:transcriptional regulator with XRE-family HTH domain